MLSRAHIRLIPRSKNKYLGAFTSFFLGWAVYASTRKAITQVVSHELIIEATKVDYYLALNKTQSKWKTDKENIAPWLLYFLNIMKKQSSQAMKIIEGDNIEYLLSEKQLALWRWVVDYDNEFGRKDAVKALSFPERTVESIIKKLVDLRRLERIGEGRATRYRVIK